MRVEQDDDGGNRSPPIDYAPPKVSPTTGLIDGMIGLLVAVTFGTLCYRFAWPWLARLYEVASYLPFFSVDRIGTWSFAVLNAVVIAGPVALVGVVTTVVVAQIRHWNRR
jgi:hypothetical protein